MKTFGTCPRRLVLGASVAAAALLSGLPALAQDATEVDGVVVTAAKTEERLQDVAQAVTVVSEDRLERIQADDFQDYAKLVPGLSLSEAKPGQTVLTLRGISTFSAGSTVGVYVDDTPYGSSSGLSNGQFYTGDLNTYDVQRVEVLRGPQGTLYGASTLGGLLKFVTNAPDPSEFSARLGGSAEQVDGDLGWSVKGLVNVPLGDRAALRVAGVASDSPGFISDPSRGLEDTNDSQQRAVRASLLFEPTDDITIRLTAVGQNSTFNGSNAVDVQTDGIGRPLVPIRPITGDLELSHGASEFSRTRYRVYNGTVDWDLGWATLVSATSYGTLEQTQLVDNTVLGTVLGFSSSDQAKFTQEFRLGSTGGERLDWIVGAYYTRETSDLGTDYTGIYQIINFDLTGSGSHLDSTFEETAVFATLTWQFTPEFDIGLGGRFAHNEQSSNQFGTGLFAGPVNVGDSDEDIFLYSVAPRWRPNENTTVYARVASGYRPGGPNTLPFGAITTASTFDADTTVSAELGVRVDLFDHRLFIDAAVFNTDWEDIQLVGIATVNAISTGVTLNGGTATSKGIEWTVVATPVEGLTLSFNGAYTDAELTSDTSVLVGGLDGDPLPYVPKWAATLDVEYAWTLTGDARAFLGGTLAYVGDRSTDYSPAPSQFEQIQLDSYSTVDLRAGVEFDRWTVQLYGKNLGDERGITALGTNSSAAAATLGGGFGMTAAVIRPRTVGVALGVRF